MELTYDKKEDVPAEHAAKFVEFTEGDKTVWMHKDLADSRKETYRTQGHLTASKEAHDAAKLTLVEHEKKAKDYKDAKQLLTDAEKIKNNQHQEVIDALRVKLADEKTGRTTDKQEWDTKAAGKAKAAIVAGLAGKATKGNTGLLQLALERDISINPEGTVVIMKDGKASGQTLEQYTEQLTTLYPTLIATVPSKGGLGLGGDLDPDPSDTQNKRPIRDPTLRAKFAELPVR